MGEEKNYEDFIKKLKSSLDGSLRESEANFTNLGDRIGQAFASNFDAGQITNQIIALDDAAVKVIKQFGVGREVVTDIKQSFADAYESVAAIGGQWSDIERIQSSASSSLNRNIILTSESYKDLFATSQATGQEVSSLIPAFKNVGMSIYQVSSEMEKVVNEAQKIGVNVSAVSSDVVSNLGLLNKYNFQNGVQGLAKMAAQAANMRITINEIGNTMEKAFEPDSAIEMAAALQRLGVTQSDLLDPLRLMDMAQNDPAELMNQMSQMSKQFVRLRDDGKFEILPGAKRQLGEVEKAMGLAQGTLSKMALSSAELDKKMSSIRFPDINVPEDQKKFIANMAEMNKEGTGFVVRYTDEKGEAQEKLTTELDEKTIKYLMERQEKAPKTMEDIATSQLTVLEQMNASMTRIANRTGRAIGSSSKATDVLTQTKKVSESVGNTFDVDNLKTKNLREQFDLQAGNLSDAFKKLSSGDGQGALDILSTSAKGLGDFIQKGLDQVKKQAELESKKYPGINMILDKIESITPKIEEKTETQKVEPEKKTKHIGVNDFILQPHEKDKIIIGGTNLDGKQNSTIGNNQITLNLNITADNRLNKDELMSVLRSTDLLQQLNKNLKSVNTNFNLT
jgi:hypothetical protein